MTDETSKTTTSDTGTPVSTGRPVDGGATTPSSASSHDAPTKVGKRQLPQMNVDVKKVRTTVARIVWAVCVFFALILAAAVLLVAIEANEQNDLVRFIGDTSDAVDLGLFDLADPIKDFNTNVPNFSDTGTVVFNYGLAAVAWLVIGRIADALIRP
jgi:hypothetical protein